MVRANSALGKTTAREEPGTLNTHKRSLHQTVNTICISPQMRQCATFVLLRTVNYASKNKPELRHDSPQACAKAKSSTTDYTDRNPSAS